MTRTRIPKNIFALLIVAALLLSCGQRKAPESSQSPSSRPKLPLGYIDVPKPGASPSKASNALELSGWALSESGIESVSVYVDRVYSVSAKIKIARSDVEKAYPGMKDAAAAGWWASLPLASLAPGLHDLTVQLKASSGAIRDLDVSVNLRP
jgi:N-acetylmuramoyl-L-alanine amidase